MAAAPNHPPYMLQRLSCSPPMHAHQSTSPSIHPAGAPLAVTSALFAAGVGGGVGGDGLGFRLPKQAGLVTSGGVGEELPADLTASPTQDATTSGPFGASPTADLTASPTQGQPGASPTTDTTFSQARGPLEGLFALPEAAAFLHTISLPQAASPRTLAAYVIGVTPTALNPLVHLPHPPVRDSFRSLKFLRHPPLGSLPTINEAANNKEIAVQSCPHVTPQLLLSRSQAHDYIITLSHYHDHISCAAAPFHWLLGWNNTHTHSLARSHTHSRTFSLADMQVRPCSATRRAPGARPCACAPPRAWSPATSHAAPPPPRNRSRTCAAGLSICMRTVPHGVRPSTAHCCPRRQLPERSRPAPTPTLATPTLTTTPRVPRPPLTLPPVLTPPTL